MNNSFQTKPAWLQTAFPQVQQYDILIGWDCEFYTDPKDPRNNKIISYQFAVYCKKNGNYFEKIIYSKARRTLQELIIDLLEELGIAQHETNPRMVGKKLKYFEILLVAHYSKAEWSMLKKRHLLIEELVEMQGTLASVGDFELPITYKHRSQKIKVTWRDTYLFTDKKGRSLQKISESCVNKKIEIPQASKEAMDVFAKQHPARFEEYALNDARIALEYYCKTIANYYKISAVEQTPLTLGDGAVKWYLKYLETKSIREQKIGRNGKVDKNWYEQKTLGVEWTGSKNRQKNKSRWIDEWFANNTYLGGINTSYRIGKFSSAEHWVLDIDISSCYPTSLAVQPIIDWSKRTKKYVLEDVLREKAHLTDKTVDMGLFSVSDFKFPAGTFQTAFPTPNEGGLIYVSEGEHIFTTYPEVVTAMSQNVQLVSDSLDEVRIFTELKDEQGEPMLAFAGFLKLLITERTRLRNEGSFFEANIVKQIYLSFYGKLGQGITDRYSYNLLGERQKQTESKISVPHYASVCTSLVRSAMIEMVNYFQNSEGVEVLNATTDGMMIAIPKSYFPSSFKVQTNEFGVVNCDNISFGQIFPNFYKDLSDKYAIRFLMQGRQNLGQDTNWIEIKHFGDLAHTWKTRVNCIVYRGVTQHIARESAMDRNIKTYEELLAYDHEEFTEIESSELTSIKDMLKYKCDLVSRRAISEHTEIRKVNLDYDYKRQLNSDGSTSQFRIIEDWERRRTSSVEIRKTGKRAIPELIMLKEAGVEVKGSLEQIILRIFVIALMRTTSTLRNIEFEKKLIAWKEKYCDSQTWKVNKKLIENLRVSSTQYPKITMTTKIGKLINGLAEELGITEQLKAQVMAKIIVNLSCPN